MRGESYQDWPAGVKLGHYPQFESLDDQGKHW